MYNTVEKIIKAVGNLFTAYANLMYILYSYFYSI